MLARGVDWVSGVLLGVELFNASWKRSCEVGVMSMSGKSAGVGDCLEKIRKIAALLIFDWDVIV